MPTRPDLRGFLSPFGQLTLTGVEVVRDETDADGRFSLGVAPGRYLIVAARPGLLQTAYRAQEFGLPGAPIVVTSGQRTEIQLTLDRGAVVKGVVRNERGEPIQNAVVQFLRRSARHNAPADWMRTQVTTDFEGAYVASGLVPDEYLMAAIPNQPLAAQFYPSADSAINATALRLKPNDERTAIDFTLPRREATSVVGKLNLPTNLRFSQDVMVVITGVQGTVPVQVFPRIGPTNTFQASLQPGSYRVDVRAIGGPLNGEPETNGQLYYSSSVITVGQDAVARDFPMRKSTRVSGRVRGLAGEGNGLRVRLLPATARQPAIRPVEAEISNEGTFTAEGLAPGRYSIELVNGVPGWDLDSVSVMGKMQADLSVSLDESLTAHNLELVVVPTTASLSGRLVDAGTAAPSYLLALMPKYDQRETMPAVPKLHLARADSEGAYVFANLPARSYTLTLLRDVHRPELNDENFLGRLASDPGAIQVTLKARSDTKLDLRLRSPRN